MTEMLVVIALTTILSAILLPNFVTVREKARRASCASNLKQIGSAIEMYKQDYDNHFPYAVDPVDRNSPEPPFPTYFQTQIPHIPMIQEVLRPYCATALFHCPADLGFDFDERTGTLVPARPTSFDRFQTSYYYRTELAASNVLDSAVTEPTKINVIFDGSGRWHAGGLDMWSRYNVLYADSHVKNVTRSQFEEAWATPISSQ